VVTVVYVFGQLAAGEYAADAERVRRSVYDVAVVFVRFRFIEFGVVFAYEAVEAVVSVTCVKFSSVPYFLDIAVSVVEVSDACD
jgi:hypothetical protein